MKIINVTICKRSRVQYRAHTFPCLNLNDFSPSHTLSSIIKYIYRLNSCNVIQVFYFSKITFTSGFYQKAMNMYIGGVQCAISQITFLHSWLLADIILFYFFFRVRE